MLVNVRFVAILLGLSFSLPSLGIEFVSREQSEKLKADFERASAIDTNAAKRLADKSIRCDMYGVRTQLQIERGVALYQFSGGSERWRNQGAQVIQDYNLEKDSLVGRRGMLVDRIRVVDGRLISQLSIQGESLTKTVGQKSPTVLAYSVCDL